MKATRTEYDLELIGQKTFDLFNAFKVSPIKFLKEMEKVSAESSFVFNPIEKINKVSSFYQTNPNLIKDDITNEDNYEDTTLSVKDVRFKEIKLKINNLINEKKLNNTVILRSEKLNCVLAELISGSFQTRSSDAIISFLMEKFENKYHFFELNFIGGDDPMVNLVKLVFQNPDMLDILLTKSFYIGAIHSLVNDKKQMEYSMFLASKSLRQSNSNFQI